jgi:hypothetical protein
MLFPPPNSPDPDPARRSDERHLKSGPRLVAGIRCPALWLFLAGVAVGVGGVASYFLGFGLGLGGKGQHEDTAWALCVGGFVCGLILGPMLVCLAAVVQIRHLWRMRQTERPLTTDSSDL